MRLGPFEIIVTIVIISAIAVIARIFRSNRVATRQSEKSHEESQAKPVKVGTSKIRSNLKRAGITFTLVGIVLLLASISLFRWAFQGYLWSLIIVAIGLVLLFLSRKK